MQQQSRYKTLANHGNAESAFIAKLHNIVIDRPYARTITIVEHVTPFSFIGELQFVLRKTKTVGSRGYAFLIHENYKTSLFCLEGMKQRLCCYAHRYVFGVIKAGEGNNPPREQRKS